MKKTANASGSEEKDVAAVKKVGECEACGKPFATLAGLKTHVGSKICDNWTGGQRLRARHGGITSENRQYRPHHGDIVGVKADITDAELAKALTQTLTLTLSPTLTLTLTIPLTQS